MEARPDQEHGKPARRSPRQLWPALAVTLLALTLPAAGAATSAVALVDQVGPEAQLALSADGRRLFVARMDRNAMRAKLLTIADGVVVSARDVAVPPTTFTVAFGRTDDHVILTTRNGVASDLVRVDLEAGTQRLIYSSPSLMRFPLEIAEDSYVFLEAKEPGGRFSRWHKFESGAKTLLGEKSYSLAAPLQHSRGALFLLEPSKPPSFRVFSGTLPAGVAGLVGPSTYAFQCADDDPLTCLRMDVRFDPIGRPVVNIQVFAGTRKCEVSGQWHSDVRELSLSRDGTTLVFHAPVDAAKKQRAIYMASIKPPDCTSR